MEKYIQGLLTLSNNSFKTLTLEFLKTGIFVIRMLNYSGCQVI